ncbi:MAG: hypothetical protein RLZZ397_104 [Pseudomonadota bacterium]
MIPVTRKIIMSRKARKGYYVRGHFVESGSELDQALIREAKGDTDVSRTDLKKESEALQALGTALMEAPERVARSIANIPDPLLIAIEDGRKIKDFGAQRRQRQYIGKLMRKLEDPVVESIRTALEGLRKASAAQTAALHEAESWRERLIAHDDSLEQWMNLHPQTDVQALRSLIRQARKDKPAEGAPGVAPRQSRAFREIFQLVQSHLNSEAEPADDQPSEDSHDA